MQASRLLLEAMSKKPGAAQPRHRPGRASHSRGNRGALLLSVPVPADTAFTAPTRPLDTAIARLQAPPAPQATFPTGLRCDHLTELWMGNRLWK